MAYTAKSHPATAPDKGSFPLDHDGICKPFKTDLLTCLKEASGDNNKCRKLSLAFLQCRMDNGLMAKESLDKLGFAAAQDNNEDNEDNGNDAANNNNEIKPSKERTGFIGGLTTKPLPKSKEL